MNEPVANACRGCGRWPSLFDLEASTIDVLDEVEPPEPVYEPPAHEPGPPDLRGEAPVEPVEPLPDVDVDPDEGPQAPTWRRILTSAIVPIAFVVYLLISLFFNDQG